MYEGERAFLVAGGPSLKETDLSRLKGEIIYSVSLTYKADLPHIDFHFIGDKNITKQFADEIMNVPARFMIVSKGIYDSGLLSEENAKFLTLLYFLGHAKPGFYGYDITEKIYGGGTSTFLAMQFAYYMGIRELYTIGLDHNWKYENTEGTGIFQGGKELLETKGKDVNHFTEDYYPDGVKWFEPNIPKIERAYTWARKAFEADGRSLINASISTKLSENIIPKKEFDECLT